MMIVVPAMMIVVPAMMIVVPAMMIVVPAMMIVVPAMMIAVSTMIYYSPPVSGDPKKETNEVITKFATLISPPAGDLGTMAGFLQHLSSVSQSRCIK
jgi:hypothetical protein